MRKFKTKTINELIKENIRNLENDSEMLEKIEKRIESKIAAKSSKN